MHGPSILPRGNWMDETGEVVQPALPHYLPRPKTSRAGELTRLDLAHWLVSRDNPLTARVFVNRLWKQFFGIGLSQDARRPRRAGRAAGQSRAARLAGLRVHGQRLGREAHGPHDRHQPDLPADLDGARRSCWPRDPDNRELARQSRFRLDAELVRDNALAISGLLVAEDRRARA